jgi:exodeoxyribonuclease VII large subunit
MQSLRGQAQRLDALGGQLPVQVRRGMALRQDRLGRAQLKLGLLDPTLVLQRGYAWLVDGQGRTITEPASARPGDRVRATLASGVLNLQVPEQD